LCRQLGEALLNALPEGSPHLGIELLVIVGVFELLDEVLLPSPHGLDLLLQLGASTLDVLVLTTACVTAQVGGEQLATVGAKDVRGEEVVDGTGERVFADPDALGVLREPRLTDVVTQVRLAGVVGTAPPAGLHADGPAPDQRFSGGMLVIEGSFQVDGGGDV
jgi:hypothetical protein